MEIQAFLAAALRRGLAPSTVRQALRVLRIALERARSFGLVTENVARQVAPPRVPRPLIVPLAPREVRALLQHGAPQRQLHFHLDDNYTSPSD